MLNLGLFCLDAFSQVEDDNGFLNFPKFEAYLKELLQVCSVLQVFCL